MILSLGFNRKRRRWICKWLRTIQPITDRQERITGWRQDRLGNTVILFVGAGAGNSWTALGLSRKGAGVIYICDPDFVDPTNLTRQFFYGRDCFHNKAIRLARNLQKEGFLGTTLIAYPCPFQELDLDLIKPDIVVCSVDLQVPGTRLDVSSACHTSGIPCVFMAVSTNADYGYLFVQEASKDAACWACALKPEQQPAEYDEEQRRCPGVPASIDIILALAGQVLYAIDTLIMERPRDWNYRVVSLSQSDFGGSMLVKKRENCPVCGIAGIDKEK